MKTLSAEACPDFDIRNRQLVLIIGSPRSGTTWLHGMISEHAATAGMAEVEQTLFSRYLQPLVDSYDREVRNVQEKGWMQGLPLLWSQAEFDGFIYSFLNQAYAKLAAQNPRATHIVDKHPGYTLHLPLIHRLLPRTKFIHLIRDGRNVAVSMISAHKQAGFGPDNAADAAALWKRHLLLGRTAARLAPGNYLELKYEEIADGPHEGLKRIFQFLDLEAADDQVEQIAGRHAFEKRQVSLANREIGKQAREAHSAWMQKLSLDERYDVFKNAGDLLRELNYATDDRWWYDGSAQRASFLCRRFTQKIARRGRETARTLLGRR